MASASAGGITSTPHFRNLQNPTSWPSRRIAMSQRMVANEPVTERFGPTINTDQHCVSKRAGAPAARTAAPLISPLGRLFMRFEMTAMPKPELMAASRGPQLSII